MEERQREKTIVKIGTAAVAILILSLWLVNLRNIRHLIPENQDEATAAQWEELRAEMDRSLQEMNRRIDEERSASTEPVEAGPTAEERATVQDILSDTAALASSSRTVDLASTTATSTILEKDESGCPKWINCMPTIGNTPRSCAVPPGCEGITQIAY